MNNWIKYISYNDGGRIKEGFKPIQKGDCVVRALSILTEYGYTKTRNELNKFIKRERGPNRSNVDDGVYPRTYRKFLEHLGIKKFYKVDCWANIPSTGRVMVVLEEHVVAYVNGVINDTFDPVGESQCGPLIGYYEF
jgi:hypothetical protein